MRDHEDFELWISAQGEGGGYRVQASGAGDAQRFVLDAAALSGRWHRLASAFTGRDRVNPEEIEDAEALGGELFRAIFTDRILFAWSAALTRAAAKDKRSGVRLVLHVQEAGLLAGLPWELLFESENRGPLAISPKTPILRCPDVQERPRPLAQAPPLRLLGVLAEPLGQPLLDLEGEWREIEKAVAPFCGRGLIEVERLVSPNLPSLRERLKREPAIHAIHFAGHGIAGALDLEKEGRIRRAEPALGQQLATLLDDAPDLRLVVINACEGASGAGGASTASLAFHLARRGLPAVVALQSAVSDPSAKLFAQKFYQELAKGSPLELAVTEAREALHDSHRGLAWAAPVLYLRGGAGELFLQEEAPAPKVRTLFSVRSRKARGLLLGAAALAIVGILIAAVAGKRIYEDLTRKPPALRTPPKNPPAPPPSSPRCPSPPGLEFSFVEIQPGPFTMGAPANRGDRTEERPQHPVEITKPYCVGAFEVTEAQFDAVLAGRDAATKPQIDLPKVGVSWDEAKTFVAKLNERDPGRGYRLLTEAEFEHSARAGSLGANVDGDGKDGLAHDANCRGIEDGYPEVAPIGSFRPNRWGLYDVQGNAQEWVADWYEAYSSTGEPQVDPQGPPTVTDHVRRGGSFDMNPKNCALWSRSHSKPDYHSNDFGFRIARSPIGSL